MTEEGGNWDTNHQCKTTFLCPEVKKKTKSGSVYLCTDEINFEAVIEMFVPLMCNRMVVPP